MVSLGAAHTRVVAAAHAVALDAGQARIFLAVNERHANELTTERGRHTWLVAEVSGGKCDTAKAQRR